MADITNLIFKYTGEVYTPPSMDNITINNGSTLDSILFAFNGVVVDPQNINSVTFDFVDDVDIKDLLFKFSGEDYTAPSITNIIFRFSTSEDLSFYDLSSSIRGYKPSFADLSSIIDGKIDYSVYNVTSLIKGIGKGQEDIVGDLFSVEPVDVSADIRSYDTLSIKSLIKGSGSESRDINGYAYPIPPVDIKSYIRSYDTLSIRGMLKAYDTGTSDISYSVHGYDTKEVKASVSTHDPVDIDARLSVLQTSTENLQSNIRAMWVQSITASLYIMNHYDIGVDIGLIEAVNLNAYLRVYPQSTLSARMMVYHTKDLNAVMEVSHFKDLIAYAGAHEADNVRLSIKGVSRNNSFDLSSNAMLYHSRGLLSEIRCTYFQDIQSNLFSVQPVDIQGQLVGFSVFDLSANLNSMSYPYDITASIASIGNYKDIKAKVAAEPAAEKQYTIPASVNSWAVYDVGFSVNACAAPTLPATINSVMQTGSIGAEIYPKVISLTSILSIVTMEHRDVSAIVNCSYMKSDSFNLSSSLTCRHFNNISAKLNCKQIDDNIFDLSASVGYYDDYKVMNSLPISVEISDHYSYVMVNRLPINVRLFKEGSVIAATINPVLTSKGLSASVNVVRHSAYRFDYMKNKQVVFGTDYMGVAKNRQDVELLFKDIVRDYFYINAEEKVYKTNKMERWVLDIKSYFPEKEEKEIKRKLNKIRSIYNLSKFSSIDEAIKEAIEYVTNTPVCDLSSTLNVTGSSSDIGSFIKTKVVGSSQGMIGGTIQVEQDSRIITL